MNDIELLAALSKKAKYTAADRKTIKELAAKHGVTIRTCKCPSKWSDAVYEVYYKVKNKREPLKDGDEIIYTGVGDVIDSKYGKIGKNTPRNVIKAIYDNSHRLFEQLFTVVKK